MTALNKIVSVVILLVASSVAAESIPFEVRGLRWGMTEKEVLQSEKAKPSEQQTDGELRSLAFIDTVAGLQVNVVVSLFKNNLFRVFYFNRRPNTCSNLKGFHGTIKEQLRSKYGEPSQDLAADSCSLVTKWELGDTRITASLVKHGVQGFVSVKYEKPAITEKAENAQKEAAKSKL